MRGSAFAKWPFEHWQPYIPQLYTIAAGIDDSQSALVDAANQIKTFPIARQQDFATKYDKVEGSVNLFYKSVEDAVDRPHSVDWNQFDVQRKNIAAEIKQDQTTAKKIIDQNTNVNHQNQASLALSAIGKAISWIIGGGIGNIQKSINDLSAPDRTAFVKDVKNLEWKPWSQLGQTAPAPTESGN
jgi:hypothetical protein